MANRGTRPTPVMCQDIFLDITTAVFNLKSAFLKHGFCAPISIELASLEDGDKLALFINQKPRDEGSDVAAIIQGVEIKTKPLTDA